MLLYPNLTSPQEVDFLKKFTFTGEETEVEKGFQLDVGPFGITPQLFCFVTFRLHHGPLSIAIMEHIAWVII